MGQASYGTTLYISGIATIFTNLATHKLTSTDNYQITDSAKRVIDLDGIITVNISGAQIDDIYTIDYLNGIIKFKTPQTGDVTISGKYLPLQRIVGAHNHKLTINSMILDNTEIGVIGANNGYRTKQSGLIDVNLALSRYDDLTKTYKDMFRNRKRVMIEIILEATSIKGWYIIGSNNSVGDVDSLEGEEIIFQLAGNNLSNFSWITI